MENRRSIKIHITFYFIEPFLSSKSSMECPYCAFSPWCAMVKSMQPRIIPRTEHRISRKQLSPNVLRTLYRLRDNGFIAYLVGGCVRDLLLERTPKDFDIATDARPSQIKRLFRNCRLVGRRFRLAHLHFHDEILELSTFPPPPGGNRHRGARSKYPPAPPSQGLGRNGSP